MRISSLVIGIWAGAAISVPSTGASAAGEKLLVSGRWDNTVLVIDLDKAMDLANDGTNRAIINRVRVTPDIDAKGTGKADTPASGQPVNVVLSPDERKAYVVNHSGMATEAAAAANQHGHAGTITVLDVAKALNPATNGTLGAVDAIIPTGGFGPVGFAVTPDGRHAFVSASEGDGAEDGGYEVSVLDLVAGKLLHKIAQKYGDRGFLCPPKTIPRSGPHPDFGCFPNGNAVGISPIRGGLVFVANGGTDDVSVLDMKRALAGDPGAEIARVPVAVGPWGLVVSPDGSLVAVANRENARTGAEGNTISILDAEKAASGAKDAEVARILVGTNNPSQATRPFMVAFTPDGQTLISTQFRSNNISFINVRKAIAGEHGAEFARLKLETPDGAPSRPRGIVFTPDGRYAAITGAPRGKPGSGVLFVVDVPSRKVVGRVTGVGNETYLLALLPAQN
jgi:DNA-binding beta-propeller fold protein YncE